MPAPTRTAEASGRHVVAGLLALTAIVGSLFLYLGPRATEKNPGVLHVGVRYANERTTAFLKYGKDGPEAELAFLAPDGSVARRVDGLRIGRNLVPLEGLDDGRYTARIRADGFRPVEVPVVVDGRRLDPAKDFAPAPGRMADYNMLGVRLEPLPGTASGPTDPTGATAPAQRATRISSAVRLSSAASCARRSGS